MTTDIVFPQHSINVSAPFPMPAIRIPDFAACSHFPIADFGADKADQHRTTAAIAAAIAAAHAAGGGVVMVPPGIWPTAAIHLKSHVNLHLCEGATLLFSDDPADYLPAVQTSWEGIECFNYSPLIYAFGCENVAITGRGTLKARLEGWEPWYDRPRPHMDALVALYTMARQNLPVAERQMAQGANNLRPQFIQFNRCRHVLIEDVSITGSPFWTVHTLLCLDVVVRRIRILAHGHNNDGVDPEMTQNMLIEDCVFDQGDDAISIKSGRDFDAWRLNTPSRNIVVRNCQMRNGHQMMAIGSELSGGIEHVLVDNCHFVGTAKGAAGWATPMDHLLFVKTNERRGGFVRDIHLHNVTATAIAGGILCVETDVLYQWKTLLPTYERRLTAIEGLHVSNVKVQQAGFLCRIAGEADMPVADISLSQIQLGNTPEQPLLLRNVAGFRSTD